MLKLANISKPYNICIAFIHLFNLKIDGAYFGVVQIETRSTCTIECINFWRPFTRTNNLKTLYTSCTKTICFNNTLSIEQQE
uniref:Uncharacterized protein n=1 Tax=Anguilla anguilla TaxID=7936 RepID=A0A0E9VRV4_ANGAN